MKKAGKNEWIKVWKPPGFEGVQINHLNFATSRTALPHIHEDYIFGFVEQGSIQLECNYCKQTHLLTAGSLTVAEAGEIFSSRSIGQAPWRQRSIMISAKRLRSIYGSINDAPKKLPHFAELPVKDVSLKQLFLSLHRSFTESATRLESDSLLLGWVSAITLPYADKPDFGFVFRTNSERAAIKRIGKASEDLIKNEIEKQIVQNSGLNEELIKKINELHAAVDFLMKVIVVRQNQACRAAEIAPETLRRKARDGETEPLSQDGSRLVFYSTKQISS